jgi:hypothetical protein
MSENAVNDRRNWKAQTFPYDHFIPDESPECQYCLTDLQAEILRGIIEPLAWHTRWWSDTDTPIDRDAIQAFRDDLIRRLMMGCCGDEVPVQYRYTGDGVLQRSEDGGTTWTDAPEYDPRNYSPEFPPPAEVEGEDLKCVAANGMKKLIKEQVSDQLTDDMSRFTLSELITTWVTTYIETSNPFLALLTVITNQIFALIIATLRPAITDEVYNKLECCFYTNMASDASFSDSQFDDVRDCITSDITGIAGVFFEHLVYLLGTRGLTNLARAGAGDAAANCDDCVSDIQVFIWDELAAEPTEIFPDDLGVYSAPSGITPSLGHYVCSIFFQNALPVPAHWKCVNLNIISDGGSGIPIVYRCSDYSYDPLATCVAQYTFSADEGAFTVTFTIEEECGEV